MEQNALEDFYDNADIMYYITCLDSDGEELSFIHGVDYEDLAEQTRKMPDFFGQVVYELTATVNGEEVFGKVSGFTVDSCLEGFIKVEAAVNEEVSEQFSDANSVDYDAVIEERML